MSIILGFPNCFFKHYTNKIRRNNVALLLIVLMKLLRWICNIYTPFFLFFRFQSPVFNFFFFFFIMWFHFDDETLVQSFCILTLLWLMYLFFYFFSRRWFHFDYVCHVCICVSMWEREPVNQPGCYFLPNLLPYNITTNIPFKLSPLLLYVS